MVTAEWTRKTATSGQSNSLWIASAVCRSIRRLKPSLPHKAKPVTMYIIIRKNSSQPVSRATLISQWCRFLVAIVLVFRPCSAAVPHQQSGRQVCRGHEQAHAHHSQNRNQQRAGQQRSERRTEVVGRV